MPISLDGTVSVGDLGDALAAKAAYPSGGTNGQALVKSGTTTAWGNAGGLVFIASGDVSGGGSVSVNNCFTSTYVNYRVVVQLVVSGATDLHIRLRASGTDATGATDYVWQRTISLSGSNVSSGASGAFWNAGPIGTVASIYTFDLFSPQVATPTGYLALAARGDGAGVLGGYHAQSTAYDGFTLYPAAGTITSPTAGIRVYGYQNA